MLAEEEKNTERCLPSGGGGREYILCAVHRLANQSILSLPRLSTLQLSSVQTVFTSCSHWVSFFLPFLAVDNSAQVEGARQGCAATASVHSCESAARAGPFAVKALSGDNCHREQSWLGPSARCSPPPRPCAAPCQLRSPPAWRPTLLFVAALLLQFRSERLH
jgi:hypothetical protein